MFSVEGLGFRETTLGALNLGKDGSLGTLQLMLKISTTTLNMV